MPVRYLLIVATFLLSVILYVDRVCISVAKDGIASDLQLTEKQIGWAFSAFSLGYALFQTPAGVLADRFGPRRLLTGVVVLWSLFTGLTGMVKSLPGLITVRAMFGAGEAGAFPGMARAVYSWLPVGERGLAQGINFSGSRLGAAFALPAVAMIIEAIGWRASFGVLMAGSLVWPLVWFTWFRDDPAEHPGLSEKERQHILTNRQQPREGETEAPLSASRLLGSSVMWFTMIQYFCSNFTFYFALTWWFPYLKKTYELGITQAGWLASLPLIAGAVGNVFSGWMVDALYRRGFVNWSRRIPAIIGFALAAVGLVASVDQTTAISAVMWFSLAIFGADMTLSPSWSHCIDIGGPHSGAVSGTMNMAGNIGSFVTALAYPYLLDWTQSTETFLYVGAGLNLLAIIMWCLLTPATRLFVR